MDSTQIEESAASLAGNFGAAWGLLGVTLLLGSAIARLAPLAFGAFDYSWNLGHWVLFVGFTVFMVYGEGYRGFQKAFSPRVASRAYWLGRNPSALRVVFAPFFCMGYFGATRKRKIVSWSVTTGVIVLIVLVRLLEQPWRGIIDVGVVLGLTWGLVAMWIFAAQAFLGKGLDRDPEVA